MAGKKTGKRLLTWVLVLVMALSLLPVSALAKLDTGHEIDVRFTVLYVGDEFNIGYNYGTSEQTRFVCQYATNHSDTAYNNHTIAISDIKGGCEQSNCEQRLSDRWLEQGSEGEPDDLEPRQEWDYCLQQGHDDLSGCEEPQPAGHLHPDLLREHDGSRHQHAKPQNGDAEEQYQPGDVHRFRQ